MSASFPLDRVRADTPGAADVVHLNNAGASLPPRPVVDAVVEHLRLEERCGGYEAEAAVAERLDGVYSALAHLVGGDPAGLALTDSATRAWDLAVAGYPFRRGDRVLVTHAEYASNAIALFRLRQRRAVEIVVLPDDEDGVVSLAALERELDRGASLVSLVHAPTSGGLVNPADEVGRLCAAYDTFYVLDACQSVGQVPLDVGSVGCDVLSATGRKYLRAPRGTGFLQLSARALDVLETPFLDLRGATWTPEGYDVREDARRFELWERNVAAVLGLGVAAEYAAELGAGPIWERVQHLGEGLRRRLAEVPGVTVHDRGRVRSGIVTFTLAGATSAEVAEGLRAAGVNTSVSHATSAQWDLGDRGLADVVRASVHYYNTEDELDRSVESLARLAASRS